MNSNATYIIIYLMAVVIANLLASWLGPWVTVFNALVLIGLNLTSRDALHDAWHGEGMTWKMGLLISTGAVLSMLINRRASRIAMASTVAFALSSLAQTVIYALLHKRARRVRMSVAQTANSAIDSLIFPWLAFGRFLPVITTLQFAAKILGGWAWSFVIKREDA